MRLVNKEFETKVSQYLFRVVVVPFRPEIYGISPEPAPTGSQDARAMRGSVMLQDKGMKVFKGFGSRISKFAMSFEFDENKLANPPVKSDQEAITSFWGIYRWPFKKYNRYTQLEGLEQTADETSTMTEALRFVTCAKVLGLSIDGGLGWLAGPDVNQKVAERGAKATVFGESRFVPEPKPRAPAKGGKMPISSCPDSSPGNKDGHYSSFERMLREAGYHGESLEPSVRLLLETEELPRDSTSGQLLGGSSSSTLSWGGLRRSNHPQTVIEGNSLTLASYQSDDDDNEIQPALAANGDSKSKPESYSLKPNDLTNAQREMLLEIEWAQRAFMQSYVIAVIDNRLTFQNIEALTIARLPNRHLPILRRSDFWDSLPQLTSLSLAIIPDWRDVVKLPTSWVQDIRVAPSQSVSGVYQLLEDHISHRKNITTLHFEWLCGGEEAPGLFARNQHILAAPLVFKAMVNRVRPPQVLSLPYVEHLSLKNCWISPHIMTRFGLSFRKLALQSLTLQSVSLTASLPGNAQPNPLAGNGVNPQNAQQAVNQAAANNLLVNFQGLAAFAGQVAPAPPAPQAPIASPHDQVPAWLEDPRIDSWAHIINTLTPGSTLADMRYARGHGEKPQTRNRGNITTLHFESCGYVRLPLDFDQTVLDPPDVPDPQVNAIAKRISDFDSFMMKSNDHALGVIVNHISALETETLEEAFNMTVGWDESRSLLAVEALADGISHPGKGRFNGTIEVPRTSPESYRANP